MFEIVLLLLLGGAVLVLAVLIAFKLFSVESNDDN